MRKILLVLASVLVYTSISHANMSQGNWRWRNDDGSETTATWKAAENTGLGTISYSSSNIRLRIELYDDQYTNTGTYNMVLCYSSNGGTDWTAITTSNTVNAFVLSSSSNFNDGDNTTSQLSAFSANAPNFVAGLMIESSLGFNKNLELGERTEYEFSIAPTTHILTNTTYIFQIRKYDGTAIDQYATNPSLTTDGTWPVELTSFIAEVKQRDITLHWKTATEVNNYGFEVERASSSTTPGQDWQKVGFVQGNGNSNSPKEYSFADKELSGGKYSYRLKQIDNDGQFEYSKIVEVSVSEPTKFVLEQNYPNPFNPTTKINFSIPEVQQVQLKVYDVLGNEVATLVNEEKAPGTYEVQFNASNLTSGIYFYTLKAGSFSETKKLMLLK